MQATIDETNYRRAKQQAYNIEHGIVPKQINKKISEALVGRAKDFPDQQYTQREIIKAVKEKKENYSPEELEGLIAKKQQEMEKAAANLDFILAAKLRDELLELKS